MSSLPPKRKILSALAKDSLKIEIELFRSALFHMKTKVFLKYFVFDCRMNLVRLSSFGPLKQNEVFTCHFTRLCISS